MKLYMYFLIKDDEWLEKNNNIWVELSTSIKKKNLIVNQYVMKNKNKKSYEGKIDTNFYVPGMPKEGSHCILSINNID